MKKRIILFVLIAAIALPVFANGSQESAPVKLTFADLSWDSVMVHNRIAAYIIEHGLEGNYEFDYVAGGTVPSVTGLANGDIDIDMESWHSNLRDVYDKYVASGDIIDLGKNLPDGPQGWYVPRYVIEGDPERGIEPMAPDLKSIKDLPKYWELFRDTEDPEKGLIYLGISGWAISEDNVKQYEDAGLADTYNYALPGSSVAVSATMDGAYKKGDAWVGYWWEPTAIMGRLDMYRIPDSAFPPADVNIIVNSKLPEKAPEVVEFLKNYSTTVDMNNAFLAAMEENNTDAAGAAVWFLKNYEEVWTKWVDKDAATKIKAALANE